MLRNVTILLLTILLIGGGILLGQNKCLYLSDQALSPPASSTTLTDKLENDWGYDVSYKNIGNYGTALITPENYDFIIIDEIISSSDMEDVATDFPKPMLNFEGWGSDFLGITDPAQEMATKNLPTQDITIIEEDHPVAGGLSGDVSLTSEEGEEMLINFLIHAEGVTGIAKGAESDNWVVAAVEEGAQLFDREAPHRMVTIGIHNNAYETLTEDAFTMIKASIDWITGQGTSIDNAIQNPATYELGQNYPNPFNPTTTINYSLEEGAKTSINIYNINGELVENIVDGFRRSGQHSVTFNATDHPAGIYFYKIESGTFARTKKMILLK